jgi:ribosomal protein S12 methylthiotransferase accessory factor
MISKSVHDASGGDLDVTRKIFEALPLKWTEGYNLTKGEDVLIPFDWFFMINEFNGPSAGNCQEEAIIQGICEVVERHVSSIISHGKLSVPAVRTDSAEDPMVIKMIENYKKAGIELYVSDFSLDMGIPSIGVLAYDPSTFPEKSEIVWTAGTTPNPEKALSRALTETAQLAGDFNTASNYVASGLPKLNRLEEADFIMNPGKTVTIRELNDLSSMNIKTEVENLVLALDKKGMDVLLINTTHPLLEIPAFYTIIPGAHFRERALGTSVGLFSAKMIAENNAPLKAVEILADIEKQLPGKYYIKFYMGSCHLSLNDPLTALDYFEQALDLDPVSQDAASIYSYMGFCLKEMEEYEKAISVLEKGRAADDERTDIYNLLGFCYFKLKEHEKAIGCFKRNIELDPSSAIDYANIGSNYRDLGDREKAIEFYTAAIKIDPTIDFAWDNLKKLQNGK